MNLTKIFLIALIASIAALLTLWLAAGATTGRWYLPVLIFGGLAFISDRLGLGSIIDFLKKD